MPDNKCLLSSKNEDGFVLLSSLVFLVILTVIGVAATNTSTIETMIAGAEKNKQKAFYAAEAGIEHCTAILMNRLANNFKATLSSNWNFALSDAEAGVESIDFIKKTIGKESFVWIKDKPIGNACTYTVMVRDNDDDSNPFDDSDNLIHVTSIATMGDGTTAGIEVVLCSYLKSGSATGYTGQAGAGSGKSYRSDDAESITTFTPQTGI
ncbi:MAG: pilus assembly PilX N-terminal domain-containing protein [Desulfobacterium sp.]|jgi:hypothetical protein|nr:pilus assembly PilX N-terminal domain-containing protein [Desulfobacterium sp.]